MIRIVEISFLRFLVQITTIIMYLFYFTRVLSNATRRNLKGDGIAKILFWLAVTSEVRMALEV